MNQQEKLRNMVIYANNLMTDETKTADFRRGVAAVVEGILHDFNVYAGFNFVDWLNGGCERWHAEGEPDFPEKTKYLGDETKKYFYLHRNLQKKDFIP